MLVFLETWFRFGFYFGFTVVAAAASFSKLFVVVSDVVDERVGLLFIGAIAFVLGKLVLWNVVKAIVGADGEEMGEFCSIFASVDVENELLLGEGVGAVEGTAGLLLLLLLLSAEHATNRTFINISSSLQYLPAYQPVT